MRIEKRSMNWIQKPSLYEQAETARLKRKAYSQATLNNSQALHSSFISTGTSSSSNAVNLTMSIAVERVRSGVKPKV